MHLMIMKSKTLSQQMREKSKRKSKNLKRERGKAQKRATRAILEMKPGHQTKQRHKKSKGEKNRMSLLKQI